MQIHDEEEAKHTALSHSHTIATTSRRPLTTTFFGVCRRLSSTRMTTSPNHPKKSGCQRSATGCRYSVTVLLLLLLLLGGRIRDRVHNALPNISVQHQSLHVCYIMPNISCNAVNIVQRSSSSVWAR